jgi:hypothetical protein
LTTTASSAAVASIEAVPVRLSRRRRAVIWSLVVVATLIGLVSILTTWVNRQMLDNDAWQKASAQVIRDPEVQSALSVYVVNQLYDNVNVAAQLEQQLPTNLKRLAGPLSSALRQPATDAVGRLLAGPRVQQLWINANAIAHQKLVNVLENKTGLGVSTGNGVVTVDLSALVQDVGTNLGLPASALAKLPPDAGVITVMKSNQLSLAQQGVRTIKVLSLWLLVLVFGLYALAIYLARGIRRQTLRNIGWAFVLVGLIVLVVRRVVGNYVIGSLTTATYTAPTHRVWLIMSSILGEIGAATILYGLVAVAGAVLAGPTTAATAVRSAMAPVINRRPGVAWAVFGFAYLLLVLWGGTHALRTWWGVLLIGGLLAAGVAALRRATLREFPDAGEAGSGRSFAAAAHSLRPRRAQHDGDQHNGDPGTAQPSATTRSAGEEIARLRELQDAGAITHEEFLRGKQIALS